MKLSQLHKTLQGKSAPGTSLYDRFKLFTGDMQADSLAVLTAEQDPKMHEAIAEAAQHMGTKLPKKVVVAESEQPLVRMLFNDTLAISQNAIELHTPEELQARIAHSLIHQKDKWRDFATVASVNLGAEIAIEQGVLRLPGLNKLKDYIPVEPVDLAGKFVKGIAADKKHPVQAVKGVANSTRDELTEKLVRAVGGEEAQPQLVENIRHSEANFFNKLNMAREGDPLAMAKYAVTTAGVVMAVKELADYLSADHSRTTYLQADYEAVQKGLSATTMREALEKVQLREEEIERLTERKQPKWRQHLEAMTPDPVKKILEKRAELLDGRPEFAERVALLQKLEEAQQGGPAL